MQQSSWKNTELVTRAYALNHIRVTILYIQAATQIHT